MDFFEKKIHFFKKKIYIFYAWLLIFFQKRPYLWNSKLQSNSFFFCINSTRLSHNHMLETIIAFAWNSNSTLKNCLVKLGLSEKHTKFEKIILMLKCKWQKHKEDCSNFCVPLKKSGLYNFEICVYTSLD